MSRRLGVALLALYPLAFRRRYGEEMLALLDEAPPGAGGVLDLLRGALAAHLRPPTGLTLAPADRLRAGASSVLACWIAFAAAGFGFYKTTEDHPFSQAGNAHPALGASHGAIQALAAVASIAVLAGALPLILTALRQSVRSCPRIPGTTAFASDFARRRAARRAAGLALGAVGLFAVATVGLVVLANSAGAGSGTVGRGAFLAWALAGLACGGACALAARRGLFAISVPRRGLAMALVCATVVTLAMALIALATAVYVGALTVDAANLAGAGNGPFGELSVGISIGIQLLIMLSAAALATLSTSRGWRALRAAA